MMSSVHRCGLNPYCCGFICCVFSKCCLASKFISDMGRYDVGEDGSLFGFRIRNISASLSVLGKCPVASIALYSLVIDMPVILGVCFSISCEIFCGPVALLFILVRNVAVS